MCRQRRGGATNRPVSQRSGNVGQIPSLNGMGAHLGVNSPYAASHNLYTTQYGQAQASAPTSAQGLGDVGAYGIYTSDVTGLFSAPTGTLSHQGTISTYNYDDSHALEQSGGLTNNARPPPRDVDRRVEQQPYLPSLLYQDLRRVVPQSQQIATDEDIASFDHRLATTAPSNDATRNAGLSIRQIHNPAHLYPTTPTQPRRDSPVPIPPTPSSLSRSSSSTQAKPYGCDLCKEHFTRADSARRHRNAQHREGGPMYTCCNSRTCSISGNREDKMWEHCRNRNNQRKGCVGYRDESGRYYPVDATTPVSSRGSVSSGAAR